MPEYKIANAPIDIPSNRVLALLARAPVGHDNAVEYVPVIAEPITVAPDWSLSDRPAVPFAWVVHRPMMGEATFQEDYGWVVADAYTGYRLASDSRKKATRAGVLARARSTLCRIGQANVRSGVLECQPAPYHLHERPPASLAVTQEAWRRFWALHHRHVAKSPPTWKEVSDA